jgi:RNA polymerase sigma factor for flagellar operon FliA
MTAAMPSYVSGAASAGSALAGSAGKDQALVREHLALVGHVVAQVAGRLPARIARDELTSAGLLALVLAARGFDTEQGAPFAAFALVRIRTAVSDALRGTERALRSPATELQRGAAELGAVLGRAPSRAELAAVLGWSSAAVEAAGTSPATDRSQQLDDAGGTLPRLSGEPAQQPAASSDRIGLLTDCLAELPDRLRTVVERHYFAQQPLAAIAAELGVAESRVVQLRAEALGYVRAALRAADRDSDAVAPAPAPGASRHNGYVAARAPRPAVSHALTQTTFAEASTLATA